MPLTWSMRRTAMAGVAVAVAAGVGDDRPPDSASPSSSPHAVSSASAKPRTARRTTQMKRRSREKVQRPGAHLSVRSAAGRHNVEHERLVIGRTEGTDLVRARRGHSDAPDVVDPLRGVVHRGRWPEGLGEVAVPGRREESYLESTGVGVQVPGDDRDLLAIPFPEDRPHLLLTYRARLVVLDIVEMCRHDQNVSDAHAHRATGLVSCGRLHGEMHAFYVGHRNFRQDRVPVEVAD